MQAGIKSEIKASNIEYMAIILHVKEMEKKKRKEKIKRRQKKKKDKKKKWE